MIGSLVACMPEQPDRELNTECWDVQPRAVLTGEQKAWRTGL